MAQPGHDRQQRAGHLPCPSAEVEQDWGGHAVQSRGEEPHGGVGYSRPVAGVVRGRRTEQRLPGPGGVGDAGFDGMHGHGASPGFGEGAGSGQEKVPQLVVAFWVPLESMLMR